MRLYTPIYSSLENCTLFQTKIDKVYTRFLDRNVAKTRPFGAAHTYIKYIRECPNSAPPPPPPPYPHPSPSFRARKPPRRVGLQGFPAMTDEKREE